MKRQTIAFAALAVLCVTPSMAQRGAKQEITKAVVSGKVGQEGKTLIGDHTTWQVSNPDALAGRQGLMVRVKCRLYAAANQILVLGVSPVDEPMPYAKNYGDAAFRR